MAYLNRGGGGTRNRKIMLQTKTWSSKHTVTGGLHTHIILLFAGAVVIVAGAGPDCLDALEVVIPGPVYALHSKVCRENPGAVTSVLPVGVFP